MMTPRLRSFPFCIRSFTTGQRVPITQLELLVNQFPPVVYAFGYGSGVFAQTDNESGMMVDTVLVVSDAQEWHEQNLKVHSDHYATLSRLGGASLIAKIQRIPPGVYFHAGVRMNDLLVKYGVVEASMLADDLRNWKYLYLAGRLQKPTVCIVENDEITELQKESNLPAALSTSLLILSNHNTSFTIQQHSLAAIYQQIATISYAGDLRVSMGAEDPLKIQKLVHSDGQYQRWNDLYKDSMDSLVKSGAISISDDGYVEYGTDELTREELCKRIPLPVRRQGLDNLPQTLASIVAPAARNQTIKGVLSAGITKSASYALNKLQKGILKKQT